MSSIPNPDALLTREQTSEALKEAGYPVEPSTLATKASRGGGPEFQKFGVRVLYRWGDVLAWAQSRLSAPRRNTSEADAIDKASHAESAPPGSAAMRSMKPHARRAAATARRRRRQRNRGEAEATTS